LESLEPFDLGINPLERALSGGQNSAIVQGRLKPQLSEFARGELRPVGGVGDHAHGLSPVWWVVRGLGLVWFGLVWFGLVWFGWVGFGLGLVMTG
jgi:hypothetical protein